MEYSVLSVNIGTVIRRRGRVPRNNLNAILIKEISNIAEKQPFLQHFHRCVILLYCIGCFWICTPQENARKDK